MINRIEVSSLSVKHSMFMKKNYWKTLLQEHCSIGFPNNFTMPSRLPLFGSPAIWSWHIYCIFNYWKKTLFCRSDTPLIYKAVPSWFVRVEHMVEKLLDNNSKCYWYSESGIYRPVCDLNIYIYAWLDKLFYRSLVAVSSYFLIGYSSLDDVWYGALWELHSKCLSFSEIQLQTHLS